MVDQQHAVVNLDDTHAQLLAQALNHIGGEGNLGLKAELMREVLADLPEEQVLSALQEYPILTFRDCP